MQLDGNTLTTPESIDQKVGSFCRSLSSETPVYVEVRPKPWCRQSCCEMNVDRLIEEDGGEKVIGYKIWYTKGKYIEAERHVVWKKDGALIDPTFNTDGEEKVLFLPDANAAKGYEDRPIKVRKGFTQKARLLVKQLDENDRNVVRMSNEESWERMLSYEDWLAGNRMPNMWREPSR